ncbi:hypothetical protein IAR50_002918 [Cryptococcus sp. DSM 104548]
MATGSDTNMNLIAILSGAALVISLHHTYKFDKCKCLIPKAHDWFRSLLTWMLLCSNMCLFAWAAGYCWVKYKLKWIYTEEYGAIPYPATVYTEQYRLLNTPLMIVFNIAFSLQTSLNAEEGLYWYHLMRAVRQPRSARSWLSSPYFCAWIVISIISTTLQCGVGWIHRGHELDLVHQMSVVMTVDGAVELIVMSAASIVIWKFPAFLDTVKASGAGPEVRSRLHFYHEANKVRTFFRFIYSVGMIILGADGLSAKQLISNTPVASDIVSQLVFGSFFFILIISIVLYLPRSWAPPGTQHSNVMVGRTAQQPGHHQIASGVALMSLLREGGQWDGEAMRSKTLAPPSPYNLDNPKLYGSQDQLTARDSDWDLKRESGPEIPSVLENFTSPIAVQIKESHVPADLRIHVKHEVHEDRGEDFV